MKFSLPDEANVQRCCDCTARRFSICAALDKTELRELAHLSHHVHFAPRETVFGQEELATSFYNLLEGVMRLYKLLPDGRRQILGFALPLLSLPRFITNWFLHATASPLTRSGLLPCVVSPELLSRILPKIGRISYVASTSLQFAS